MYTSALERTVNWVTLVSLLVEYLLYSVLSLISCMDAAIIDSQKEHDGYSVTMAQQQN